MRSGGTGRTCGGEGLDLFCKAGGATRGYQMAGFHMTGVDVEPQPRYVGERFVQADALEYRAKHGHEYDFVHASPPCQHSANVTLWRGTPNDTPTSWARRADSWRQSACRGSSRTSSGRR